jgi:hypothetical protein
MRLIAELNTPEARPSVALLLTGFVTCAWGSVFAFVAMTVFLSALSLEGRSGDAPRSDRID